MTLLAEAPPTMALARMETKRMVRHPVTVAATLLLVTIWVSSWFALGTSRYPVLQDLDRDSAIGVMILLGGAALIVGNLAVLRGHRDGTTGLSQVLILPGHARTVAHLAASLPLAGLGALLLAARMTFLAVGAPAAGRPDVYALTTGPAAVLLLGALGVLLGRLSRSAVVAPLALLVVLASLAVLEAIPNGGGALWLAPQGAPALPMPVPVSLLGRPSGAHLGYVLGLAALLAVAALLRSGARGVRVTAAGVAALVCAVGFGAAQLPAPAVLDARADAMYHPARYGTCRQLGGVRYCAFDGFDRWIPAWNTVVQTVVEQVPAAARSTPLTIRQRFAFVGLGDGKGPGRLLEAWRADDAIGVGTQWGGRGSAAALAGQVAYRLVTGRTAQAQLEHGVELSGVSACGGAGVLVAWLAGSFVDGGRDGIAFDENELIPGVSVPAAEAGVAMEALDRPHADIAARVQRSWDTLAAPGTTAAQAAQILGVTAPAGNADCR